MTLLTISLILFLILDPIGNAPVFADAVADMPPRKQRRILARESLFALCLMLGFNLVGESIFHFLEIDEASLRVASGIILFLVSLKILFPKLDIEFHRGVKKGEEPWLVPLAIPTLAGPSLLATVMLFAHIEPGMSKMTTAIVIAWGISALIILASPAICRRVSRPYLEAMESLMGMILILLAVQRLLEGVQVFLQAQGVL